MDKGPKETNLILKFLACFGVARPYVGKTKLAVDGVKIKAEMAGEGNT